MWTRSRILIAIGASLFVVAVAIHFISGIGLQGPLPNSDWVYAGTTTLDRNGEAIIQLPAYIKQRDNVFTYQVLGADEAMPNLHIKSQIHDNSFSITGGIPGKVIAWQLIGHSIKSQ